MAVRAVRLIARGANSWSVQRVAPPPPRAHARSLGSPAPAHPARSMLEPTVAGSNAPTMPLSRRTMLFSDDARRALEEVARSVTPRGG